jgi:hypothetical protein
VTSQSATAVVLSWTAPSPAPGTYGVLRAAASGNGSWGAFSQVGSPATTSFTDNTGTAGQTYLYQVTNPLDASNSNPVAGSFVTAAAVVSGVVTNQLAAFFTGPFVKTASYTRFGYAPVNIPVIYAEDNKSLSAHNQDMNSSYPEVICKTSDVPYATNKDLLVLEGVTYYVRNVGPDGTGLTVLTLSLDDGK